MKTKIQHPEWANNHKKPGTELKFINGRYYLYGVKSVYDKALKKSKKISLGIIGSISEKNGFTPSQKQELIVKSKKGISVQSAFVCEYGYAKWLLSVLENDGILSELKKSFPCL